MTNQYLQRPIAWRAPEARSNHGLGSSKEIDIWNFGLCLAQISLGIDIQNQYDSPPLAFNSFNLTKSFRSVLHGIFNVDPRQRPSAWDLLHFEFFRNDETFVGDRSGLDSLSRPRTRRESEALVSTSEYSRKFVEEGRLGRGGFGEVSRARNRTDGQLYAVSYLFALFIFLSLQ